MSAGKINPQVVKKVRENSEGDEVVAEFLIDLIYKEAEHGPGWWWSRTYRKKVKAYSNKWRDQDED